LSEITEIVVSFKPAMQQEQDMCADNCNIPQLWDIGTESQIAVLWECLYCITKQRELQDTLCVHDMENSCKTVFL